MELTRPLDARSPQDEDCSAFLPEQYRTRVTSAWAAIVRSKECTSNPKLLKCREQSATGIDPVLDDKPGIIPGTGFIIGDQNQGETGGMSSDEPIERIALAVAHRGAQVAVAYGCVSIERKNHILDISDRLSIPSCSRHSSAGSFKTTAPDNRSDTEGRFRRPARRAPLIWGIYKMAGRRLHDYF